MTGTKRSRDNDEECEDSVATKVPATSSVVFCSKDAVTAAATPTQVAKFLVFLNSAGSSEMIWRSSSVSQEEDQQIGGEGDAVMHMNLPVVTDEYKLCFSAKVENGPCTTPQFTEELRQTRGQCVYDRRNLQWGPCARTSRWTES